MKKLILFLSICFLIGCKNAEKVNDSKSDAILIIEKGDALMLPDIGYTKYVFKKLQVDTTIVKNRAYGISGSEYITGSGNIAIGYDVLIDTTAPAIGWSVYDGEFKLSDFDHTGLTIDSCGAGITTYDYYKLFSMGSDYVHLGDTNATITLSGPVSGKTFIGNYIGIGGEGIVTGSGNIILGYGQATYSSIDTIHLGNNLIMADGKGRVKYFDTTIVNKKITK